MKIVKILCFALLSVLGVGLFLFGGYDDSPGAQLLGVLVVATGLFCIYRVVRQK